MEKYVFLFLKFPQSNEGRPNFFGVTSSAKSLNYLVPSSVF